MIRFLIYCGGGRGGPLLSSPSEGRAVTNEKLDSVGPPLNQGVNALVPNSMLMSLIFVSIRKIRGHNRATQVPRTEPYHSICFRGQ